MLQNGDVLPKDQTYQHTQQQRQDDLRGYAEFASGWHYRTSIAWRSDRAPVLIATQDLNLLEVPVIQGVRHAAYVFGEKHTGVAIHQKRQLGPLGEHL
jgi:hypothetical protein